RVGRGEGREGGHGPCRRPLGSTVGGVHLVVPILALGVSYRHAPVELLERLSFVHEDYPKAYRRLIDSEAVNEGVILSTCNRTEVFAEVATYHAGFLDLKRFLCESRE